MSLQGRFQSVMVLTDFGLSMKVRDSRSVKGMAGQRARFESLGVVNKTGDDYFREFLWEGTRRLYHGGRELKAPV